MGNPIDMHGRKMGIWVVGFGDADQCRWRRLEERIWIHSLCCLSFFLSRSARLEDDEFMFPLPIWAYSLERKQEAFQRRVFVVVRCSFSWIVTSPRVGVRVQWSASCFGRVDLGENREGGKGWRRSKG